MKIILIGMPGTGKSYTGKQLAKVLNFKFVDDDLQLFDKHKLNTTELLEKVGDEEFLKLEEVIFLQNLEQAYFPLRRHLIAKRLLALTD